MAPQTPTRSSYTPKSSPIGHHTKLRESSGGNPQPLNALPQSGPFNSPSAHTIASQKVPRLLCKLTTYQEEDLDKLLLRERRDKLDPPRDWVDLLIGHILVYATGYVDIHTSSATELCSDLMLFRLGKTIMGLALICATLEEAGGPTLYV